MTVRIVGVIGATSLVGEPLLSQLVEQGYRVIAFSRKQQTNTSTQISWATLDQVEQWKNKISLWICVAPIWVLSDSFYLYQNCGARRIVALSSTSVFTKQTSSDLAEQNVATLLRQGESAVQEWAEKNKVDWTILRPTLIYGYGKDKNISEIVRFIKRFGFFPLFGKAEGLRQPIHADDVASACIAALNSPYSVNKTYNISGQEILTYREMVQRVFKIQSRKPFIITIPLFIFKWALKVLRLFPRYQSWSIAMAERMNMDLTFDHSNAIQDFNFSPRPFYIELKDVTKKI